MKLAWTFFLSALLTACASAPKLQSSELTPASFKGSAVSQLDHVPFIDQQAGHCGPASLAMMMAAIQHPVDLQELTAQVYVPGAKGSFQTDMLSAVRRQSLLALPVRTMQSVLQEVQQGQPVLVFQNLGFSWAPQWHYAVVTGYDLYKKEIILHSGPEKNVRRGLRIFEQSWLMGDYWAYTILKPGFVSGTATEMDHLQAALTLEQSGQVSSALQSYLAIHKKWPASLKPILASANLYYQRGNLQQAHQLLLMASNQHPDSFAAWNNLAVVQKKLGQSKNAKNSLERSLALQQAADLNHESKSETTQ